MGTIAKIHEMLVNRECSCAELTQSYLTAIKNDNAELNAYVTVTPDEAMQAACEVDRKLAAGERSVYSRAYP